jgi:acyl-CoA reductase-like NAD-dependent aldehyde dehydrogenase
VSFTGSTATGLAISRKTGIKKLLLELGGNAPMVILDDADLDYAVESAVFGSFYNVATAREEVFGPAITIIEAHGDEEALRLANDTEYGLSSAVHTSDAEHGVQFALRLQAGMTHVNDSPVNEEDNTAYGGEKLSGLGRFGGTWSVDEFTTHHWISVQHTPRPYPIPAPA